MSDRYISIFIEAATGDAFELVCSPLDTIYNIKKKIQILEDIPVQQQHLIWMCQELSNSLTLVHYGIQSGATIKLILGMKVGPASFRKVEHEVLIDLAHFVKHFRRLPDEDGVDRVPIPNNDSMHFFFPEPDSENTFEGIRKISEMSSESARNLCANTDEERCHNEENEKMKAKVADLMEKMRVSKIKKANRSAVAHVEKYSSSSSAMAENSEFSPSESSAKSACSEAHKSQEKDDSASFDRMNEELAKEQQFHVVCNDAKEKFFTETDTKYSPYSSTKSEISGEENGAVPKLPSINNDKKKKKRCSWCKKKIGLTTTYTCRCGKEFCGPHRYAEVHECTYDYKAEGQQMLRVKNPIIRAPKLPKI